MENEKLKQYIERINKDKACFINMKALESLIRIEEQESIDEMAYLKALEILGENIY